MVSKLCQLRWLVTYLDIRRGDIPKHVQVVINHRDRGHTLIVHHMESIREGFITTENYELAVRQR